MLCFFNLGGAIHDPDVAGYEVETIADARMQAALSIAEVIRDKPAAVWAGEEIRMEVADERQATLFTIVVVGVDAPAMAGQRALSPPTA